MTKEKLLAHILSRIDCLHHQGGEPTSGTGWLSSPGESVDLAAFGVDEQPQEFNFAP